ncbi:MAG: hypothetical protein GF401_09960 [Chitinivibrionales bacterium]|nr:hypothetical protein [Chitinivibrionales bacterium]
MANNSNGVTKTCLNGYWDILPDYGTLSSDTVPEEGWISDTYLVPSFWTKSTAMVRKKGETYYRPMSIDKITDNEEWEFLFDAFRYPLKWSTTRKGWVRRSIDIKQITPDKRYFLLFEAVMPHSHLFLNGKKICSHHDCALPLEIDVTEHLKTGTNEVALYIDDYPRNHNNRFLTPVGTAFTVSNSGIWQDVYLIERSDLYVSDITIRPSVRNSELTAVFEITNSSQKERTVTVAPDIIRWDKHNDPYTKEKVLSLPSKELTLAPNSTECIECSMKWEDPELWSPGNPVLYQIRTSVEERGRTLETTLERFGFREIWIEGHKLILNGSPVHLFSDWGHKLAPFWLTEAWVRKWFGMIHDANMNHSRLHNAPHPRMYLDLADEEGILITAESLITGSGKILASESPEFWEAARKHLKDFIRRDKNHPSILLWSYENEMRWNEDLKGECRGGESDLLLKEPPRLQQMIHELDPTRIAYPDGDTTIWNEGKQPIISRHYGKACSGLGWWHREQPLLSSEMSWYHMAGPHNVFNLGGDKAYADFHTVDDWGGLDTQLIVEAGRTLGVSCFGPWNVSCVCNLRMEKEPIELHYDDLSAPGTKPLYVEAHSSEFSFWKDGKGYTPHHSFGRQVSAFRPFAAIDLSLNSQYYLGDTFEREIHLVNDTDHDIAGGLSVTLEKDGVQKHGMACTIEIPRGEVVAEKCTMKIPEKWEAGTYTYKVAFTSNGAALEIWDRQITFASGKDFPAVDTASITAKKIGLHKADYLHDLFTAAGISFVTLEEISENSLRECDIAVLGKNCVVPESSQNTIIDNFISRGGRIILLEQECSLFPSLTLEHAQVLSAFPRAYDHPVLNGFSPSDFEHWGEDPYASLLSDSFVAQIMYRKDDLRSILPIIDSGEGRWGEGGIYHTPLFEYTQGKGCLLACQLRISDKFRTIPAAARLMMKLLEYAAAYVRPEDASPVLVADGSSDSDITRAVEHARSGGNAIIESLTPKACEKLNSSAGTSLSLKKIDEIYQAVRVADAPVLSGVSNEDICCIETWTYAPPSTENFVIGDWFLDHTDGLEPLLATPTQSCLKELMVYNGKKERVRAHTLSRFLYDEKPEEAVVLGRIPVEAGHIYINQFAPPLEKRDRFRRLKNRLAANLGADTGQSPLSGTICANAGGKSPGYPGEVQILTIPVDQALEKDMRRCCRITGEGCPNKSILNIDGWKIIPSDGGTVAPGVGSPLYVYYQVFSPINRMTPEYLEPDPKLLSNLACKGSGTMTLFVNGAEHGTQRLTTEESLFDGIPLIQRFNQILIKWEPESNNSTLAMQWRTWNGAPESEFNFTALKERNYIFPGGNKREGY